MVVAKCRASEPRMPPRRASHVFIFQPRFASPRSSRRLRTLWSTDDIGSIWLARFVITDLKDRSHQDQGSLSFRTRRCSSSVPAGLVVPRYSIWWLLASVGIYNTTMKLNECDCTR
jgi:hypothetical protein